MGYGAWDGGEVHRLRRRMGVSQQELAALLGVRQQTVSDWERNLHAPQGAARRMLSVVAEERASYETSPRPRKGRPPRPPEER